MALAQVFDGSKRIAMAIQRKGAGSFKAPRCSPVASAAPVRGRPFYPAPDPFDTTGASRDGVCREQPHKLAQQMEAPALKPFVAGFAQRRRACDGPEGGLPRTATLADIKLQIFDSYMFF
jgi:hypothetical protein